MTWDGTAFRNAAKNAVLCFGRANAYTAAFPVNPLAPTDRWILVESSGYMSVGPAGDLPTGNATLLRYQMEWFYSGGNWIVHTTAGATISNVNLETAPGIVTNLVTRYYQPVATVSEVDALADTTQELGEAIADVPCAIDAAIAQLPQDLRALAARDDRADTLRVSRTNTVQRQNGVKITGGAMIKFYDGNPITLTWDGTRFYGEWAPGEEGSPVSVVGYGRDTVTLPGYPVNPTARRFSRPCVLRTTNNRVAGDIPAAYIFRYKHIPFFRATSYSILLRALQR